MARCGQQRWLTPASGLGAVKGVERRRLKPVYMEFTGFIKIDLHIFLYTFVFA